ncbi:hypothetical protein HYW83_01015 [Candidatus Peregrinibacteria bacterium]|nr:hypothetical protein [Candidatus Peregrinibacteria bacterium]
MNDKYFRTASFYIAAFLFARGFELVNIDKTDPKRCNFVFVDAPEREALLGVFNFGKENHPEAMVDARKMVFAVRTLKDKLHQSQ